MLHDKKEFIARHVVIDGVSTEDVFNALEIPPDRALGDIALPCFKFAKALRKSPVIIAEEVAKTTKIKAPLKEVTAVNGFVNFKFDKSDFAETLICRVLKEGEHFGAARIGHGKCVCIDYSSINIAKPFHIGHLMTTVIGASLYRVYQKLGYKTVGINHLGDWGTQFGKLIVAYKKWGNGTISSVKALNELYVKFHAESEKDDTLNDLARAAFKAMENGDKDALDLYNLFKEITLKEVEKTYKRLRVTFDSYNGEAFYNDKMQPVLDELSRKNLLIESEGALVVDLEKYGMPPCLLVKADGATLYATRDLAAIFYRKRAYDFDKCLYVVAYQQNLHFKQVFKTVELMGYPWAENLVHVPFGMVSLEDGAMSTRKGNVVLLEDVLNAAAEKSLKIIAEKSPDLANKEAIAESIGVGAVIFGALYNSRIKDIVFSYERALSFDGETGPYVQYTNARCISVLEKAGEPDLKKADFSSLSDTESADVVAAIEAFPEAVLSASERFEPSSVARNLTEVCRAFNRFYLANRILGEQDGVKHARLALTKATHIVLEEGLRLLGIDAPKKM